MSRETLAHIIDVLNGIHQRYPENECDDQVVKILIRKLEHVVLAGFHQLKEMMMSLTAEVQSLVDAVAAQGVAITDAVTELTKVEVLVVDLQKQLADLQAQDKPIDADDLAAIVSATNTVSSSISTLKAAMPQPVDTGAVVSPAPAADAPAADATASGAA